MSMIRAAPVRAALAAMLAVLALGAAEAAADVVSTWADNRDACSRSLSAHLKRGTYNTNRTAANNGDGVWFGDWSTADKEAIKALMDANPDYTLSFEVMTTGTAFTNSYTWTVASFKALYDWDEANATWEDAVDTATPTAWTKMDGTALTCIIPSGSGSTNVTSLDHQTNTNNFPSAVPATGGWIGVTLDPTVVSWLLDTNPDDGVRGLIMQGRSASTIYTDEATYASRPRLVLNTPEPATLMLMLIGGGLVALRRRH